jgi:hypothetical protein
MKKVTPEGPLDEKVRQVNRSLDAFLTEATKTFQNLMWLSEQDLSPRDRRQIELSLEHLIERTQRILTTFRARELGVNARVVNPTRPSLPR